MTHERVFPLLAFGTGEITGSTTPKQLEDIPAEIVRFKAREDNASSVNIGIGGVRLPDQTDNEYVGWELEAGEETPWIITKTLMSFWIICDVAGNDLIFMRQY